MTFRGWIGTGVLLAALLATGLGLAAWKHASMQAAASASASQPEPVESVSVAVARESWHRPTTTAIGTVLALRSITLQNELPGTVRQVMLTPGEVVEPGTVLVALDVSVEEAELRAQQAQVVLAETLFGRVRSLNQKQWVSDTELDRARAERDVAIAQIARTKAIIERKTIRAPFRARVGLADVHTGQYLEEGTILTTLQGVDKSAHVDFTVEQDVATSLREGDTVEIFLPAGDLPPIEANVVAIDARVDPATRAAAVRARIDDADSAVTPGAAVRVRVPVGPRRPAVAIPASALRKDPGGDHVFVLASDRDGNTRAHERPVEVGASLGDEVVILGGLAAGERVAASGSFKLREAALVAPVNTVDATASSVSVR